MNRRFYGTVSVFSWVLWSLMLNLLCGADLPIPRAHDRPPGPPLAPQEALRRIVVPAGMQVDLVAAEPDLMNPVALFIDEKGRFWVTESFEYPRATPGPGRDRVKVLEDRDGDGAVDHATIFAEGLNIPSGIAVGYGGVWVANAPDLLFLQDTDGDLKADRTQVVVTGFGRTDTHELPSALTWGPDGWLYGLNGVFNYSHVKYAPENPHFDAAHPGWQFTCALWRIHPVTREFQIFAEGTSNPWGVAINEAGEFFVSACVIDHLWHLIQSAYYIRQGGPYPPHTWALPSIVTHTHQKAAYCGITWFDTDGYPDSFRRLLVMGNIHGNCLNADRIEPHGSTYRGTAHPGFPPPAQAWKDDQHQVIRKVGTAENPQLADFLSANDPWFMPVAQATGADGHLYVLDWYDRYHCYQDAMADAPGIDRARGRLYRVRYGAPLQKPFPDLQQSSDIELVEMMLHGRSEYHRHTARRLLGERLMQPTPSPKPLITTLRQFARDRQKPPLERLRAAWALSCGQLLDNETITALQTPGAIQPPGNPILDAWALRWMGERENWDWARWKAELARYETSSNKPADEVRTIWVQSAIALGKLSRRVPSTDSNTLEDILAMQLEIGARHGDDPAIPGIVWQNIASLFLQYPATSYEVFQRYSHTNQNKELATRVREIYTVRIMEALFDSPRADGELYAKLLNPVLTDNQMASVDKRRLLTTFTRRIVSGSLDSAERQAIRQLLLQVKMPQEDQASAELAECLVALGDDQRLSQVAELVGDLGQSAESRLFAFQTLVSGGHSSVAKRLATQWLDLQDQQAGNVDFTRALLLAWAGDPSEEIPQELLGRIGRFDKVLRPTVIEVLSQRAVWSQALLEAIQTNVIDKNELNYHQIQRIAVSNHAEVRDLARKIYGQLRQGTREDRQQAIADVRESISQVSGDPKRGRDVFQRTCATCHKLYGHGADVGPDITRNGRNNWDQLLQNVFDPSLVIGPAYQARVLVTADGRSLTGIPIEETDARVVLKIQGGKIETIPRSEIDIYQSSEVSLMPEGLEKQLTKQELVDLLQYLALTERPEEEDAKWIPGTPEWHP